MNDIRHLLFATDGSEYSAGAQRVAIELAKRCGAQLTVMTIVMTTSDLEAVGTGNLRAQMESEAQERLEAAAGAARQAGVACATQLAYGEDPGHEIITTAAALGADLIVLGRRGKRGLARFMVGHATARVAGEAPCNVLVVPRAAQAWSQRVLVASDGSAPSGVAVRAAIEVARQCELPMTAVSATTASHSDQRKLEARAAVDRAVEAARQAGVDADGQVVEGRPDEVVIETAAARGADLIVTGSHGRTGLSRLLLGSTSERIIGQALCPVLVAK